jgi:pimeloyl-ACP methyl ester carboxylesterase
MIDRGAGHPVVLIPGIQGRWEWMRPALEELARHCRIITGSLPGEPHAPRGPSPGGGFDRFLDYVDGLLDGAGLQSATVVGVSYGGLIALRYAARRKERVRALILVSSLGFHWQPDRRTRRYMRWPTLSGPLFFAGAIRRTWPELVRTFPEPKDRLSFCLRMASIVLRAPAVPRRMAERAALAARERFEADCRQVTSPTLVVAGEPDLDRVVADATLEYVAAIRGARSRVLERTGHLGIVSAPERFAAIVTEFVNRHEDVASGDASHGRRQDAAHAG